MDHSHSSEIAHFIKEPKMGSAFLLKLMDPTGKTVQGPTGEADHLARPERG